MEKEDYAKFSSPYSLIPNRKYNGTIRPNIKNIYETQCRN